MREREREEKVRDDENENWGRKGKREQYKQSKSYIGNILIVDGPTEGMKASTSAFKS